MSYGCRLEREKRERQLRLEDSLYDPALVVQKPKSIATRQRGTSGRLQWI